MNLAFGVYFCCAQRKQMSHFSSACQGKQRWSCKSHILNSKVHPQRWRINISMKRAGGGVCLPPLPALTQRGACTLTLPPGWKKQWVCVWGEALTCLRIASTGQGKSRGQTREYLLTLDTSDNKRELREMLFVHTEGILLNCKRRGRHSLTGSLVSRSCSCIVRKLLFLQYSHKKKSKVFL